MNKTHHEELFDSHVKYAGRELLIKMAKEAPSEEELSSISMPLDDLDERIASSINKEVNKRKFKRAVRASSRVAAALLVLLVISAITITSSNALRERFQNLFISSNDISADISFVETDQGQDKIKPGYLPGGFILSEAQSDGSFFAMSYYTNDYGKHIRIFKFELGSSGIVDTEHSNIYEIEIQGKPAVAMEMPDDNFIFFTTDSNEFEIVGNIGIKELMLVAESLE